MAMNLGGISGRDLAGLAGVGHGTPGAILRGQSASCSLDTCARMARVLGLSLDWLATGEGEPPTKETVRRAIEAARASATTDQAA